MSMPLKYRPFFHSSYTTFDYVTLCLSTLTDYLCINSQILNHCINHYLGFAKMVFLFLWLV